MRDTIKPLPALTLSVAGAALTLYGPDPWMAPLAARYADFLSPGEGDWRVDLLEDAGVPNEEPGWAQHEGPVTRFHVLRYRGEIDLAARSARVTAPSPAHAASAAERTLTYILMQALPREGDALLLHAAGVALGGQGLAFCGASGAGKTTVARLLSDGGELYGDENMVLRLTGNQAELVSTPFWGASAPWELIRRIDRSAPLQAIFALEKAPEFALRRLPPGEAVTALLATEKVATERVESAAAWLGVAARLVERVPVFTLRFRPTPELLPFLSRHFGR